jgi:hypothetical protein
MHNRAVTELSPVGRLSRGQYALDGSVRRGTARRWRGREAEPRRDRPEGAATKEN